MLELLVEVLKEYGLDLNVQKTKMFSTEPANSEACYCDTECGMVEMLSDQQNTSIWDACSVEKFEIVVKLQWNTGSDVVG